MSTSLRAPALPSNLLCCQLLRLQLITMNLRGRMPWDNTQPLYALWFANIMWGYLPSSSFFYCVAPYLYTTIPDDCFLTLRLLFTFPIVGDMFVGVGNPAYFSCNWYWFMDLLDDSPIPRILFSSVVSLFHTAVT